MDTGDFGNSYDRLHLLHDDPCNVFFLRMIMILGFTGSQKGMTAIQEKAVSQLISNGTEFHHGDCVGADFTFHLIVRSRFGNKSEIVIHPPIDPIKRAFCEGTILEPQEYLIRNKAIVDACEILIATPGSVVEELRSGTWSTIRYALKKRKKTQIVFPDGSWKFHM